MFTPAERERVRDRLVELATSDKRLLSAALVGSLAGDEWDEWSDVDLTFGVDDGFAFEDALEDWTRTMVEGFDAVQLFDLSVRGTTYRVFLLDDWLQVDLSFTPASEFRQRSPKFKLLWGTHTTSDPPLPSANDLFGWGVIYARAARASIDRERWWQAGSARLRRARAGGRRGGRGLQRRTGRGRRRRRCRRGRAPSPAGC